MYKCFPVILVALAISSPAHADIFGLFSSGGGPEQVVDGHAYAPAPSTIIDGSMHGYPFYSGCCEPKSPCSERLWSGFCASKGCGMKPFHSRHFGHAKGGCGPACGKSFGHGCGKGSCGYAAPCGCGKVSWGRPAYRGLGGKGGCGLGHACGGKGCGSCDPCGPKHHCRLGLFDWLHFGRGHGCHICGDLGCSSCGKGGKGGYIEYAPSHGVHAPEVDKRYYGTPSESGGESTLQPPEVLVEPTSISDRSARRRQIPANPFAQPFSY